MATEAEISKLDELKAARAVEVEFRAKLDAASKAANDAWTTASRTEEAYRRAQEEVRKVRTELDKLIG